MKKIFLFLMVIVLISSCDGYLDIKPRNKVLPKTSEEYGALIHSLLKDIDYGMDKLIIGNAGSVSNYDAFTENLQVSLSKAKQGLPKYIGVSLNGMQTDYSSLYSQIKKFNVILDEMDITKDENLDLVATCYTLRGICYYHLVRMFCEPYEKGNADNQLGVPLVTVFDMEAKPIRSSLEDCVLQIEKDLKEAIKLNRNQEEYRFNVDVAKAFLTRLYYWTNNWGKVITGADELLKKYPLLQGSEYAEMINSKSTRKGNELLRSYILKSKDGDKLVRDVTSNVNNRPVSIDFIKLFDENDTRLNLFVNEKRETIKPLVARIRSAEFCLMLAEAYAHLGQDGKALEYLNMIRRNRINNYVDAKISDLKPVDKNYLIKVDAEGKELTPLTYAILTERQKEMFMEGDRWFQLKKNGRPEFWVGYDGMKYTTKKFMYTAPISRTDCQLVPGMKQNPGYVN